MTIRFATILTVVSFATVELAASLTPVFQESAHFVSADRVSVRRMSDVPAIDLAPGVHVPHQDRDASTR